MSIVQYCIHSQSLLMYTYTHLLYTLWHWHFVNDCRGRRGILQALVTSLLLLVLVPDLHSSQDGGNTLPSPSILGSLSISSLPPSGLAPTSPSLPLAAPYDWPHCHIKGCSQWPRPYLIPMAAMHSCYFPLLHSKPSLFTIIQLLLSVNLRIQH